MANHGGIAQTVFATVLAALACAGTGQAADKIRYEELRHRLTPFGYTLDHRGFKVITRDGTEHRGRTLNLELDHVRVFHSSRSWEDLPSGQILRIEIRQTWRFVPRFDTIAMPVSFPAMICGLDNNKSGPGCTATLALVLSPILVPVAIPFALYELASAPVMLAADGVAFFIPVKVYEILH